MPNKKKKDNIRLRIEKEWPSAKAFGTILPNYMITPDSTFTRLKTGVGDIEYFNEPYINYGSEDSPNIILNPNGNIPTLLYSPLNNSLDDIKLDLLHHYRYYDPVYLDLLQDYTSTLNKGEILWNSLLGDLFRNKYPDTYNKHWEEWDALVDNTPANSLYMILGIDGSLRNLLAKEETIKKSNYAPREEAILQYLNTPKAQQAFNNIQQYLKSNRLPEVTVTPNNYANGGSLKSPLDWNELTMKEKAAYIRMGVVNGYKDIDSIRLVYSELLSNLFGGGGEKLTATKKLEYIYDVLPRLLKEAGLNIRVTSGYRPVGAVGTAGSRSWHPRHGAVDIVPMGKTTFEDIEEVLHTNPTIVKYMLDNGFGLLDESGRSLASKDTMKRTGATGAHFHIGRDSKPAALYKQRVASIPQTVTTDNRRVYFSNPFLPIPEDTPKQVVSIQTPAKPLLNTALDTNIPTDLIVMQLEEPVVDKLIPEVVVTALTPRRYAMPNPQELLALMNSMMVPYELPEIPKPITATERLALLNKDRNTLLLQDLEDSILRANRLGTPLDEVKLARDVKDLQFYRNMSANGGPLENILAFIKKANNKLKETLAEGSKKGMEIINDASLGDFYNPFTHVYDDEDAYRGPAQNTFLLPRGLQEEEFIKRGYIRGKDGDYGLVKRAVGNNNYPVYQRNPDAISRDKLIVLGNTYNSFLTYDTDLEHENSAPSAVYTDGLGNFYQKRWDLNDYGGEGGSTAGILGSMLDFIGNPTVVTTGYQPFGFTDKHPNYKSTLKPMMAEKGLVPTEVEGKTMWTLPEVVVTAPKKHSIGGPLVDIINKYADGGLLDWLKQVFGLPIESSGTRVKVSKDSNGNYTFNGRKPAEGYTYYDGKTQNVYKFVNGKRTLLKLGESSKNTIRTYDIAKNIAHDDSIAKLTGWEGVPEGEMLNGLNRNKVYRNINPENRISIDNVIADGIRYGLDYHNWAGKRNTGSKGDEALFSRHLGRERNLEEMPITGIRFFGDYNSDGSYRLPNAEYTGIPNYAKRAISRGITEGSIDVDPTGEWTPIEENMYVHPGELTLYKNFSIRENNDSGIYDVFDTYDFPNNWWFPNLNRPEGKQIEVRDTVWGPNAIPELYDPSYTKQNISPISLILNKAFKKK